MFADDSAVFADTNAEATDTLYNIARIAQSYGLKINAEKTKALTTDGSPAHVHLDRVQIEQVHEFKYSTLTRLRRKRRWRRRPKCTA